MATIPTPPGHVRLLVGRHQQFVALSGISRLERRDDCTYLHRVDGGKPYLLTLAMSVLMRRFEYEPDGQFLCIHQAHAVRVADISQLDLDGQGLVLRDGTVLPIGNEHRLAVWQAAEAYNQQMKRR